MSLTRKLLEDMGLTAEQIESVIQAHTETINGLTAERNTLKDQVASLEQQRGQDAERIQQEFDQYKEMVEADKTNNAKTAALKAALKTAGVQRDEFADLLMGRIKLDEVVMEGDAIKDVDQMIAHLKGQYAGCFADVQTMGMPMGTPPAGEHRKLTRDEIMMIDDAEERQQAIAEHHELFGF